MDNKYFISEEQLQKILGSNFNQERCRLQQKDCADTLLSRDWKDPKLVQVGKLVGGKWDAMHEQSKRVYSADGIAPTLHTNGGGNLEPKVYIGALRGRNPDNPSSRTLKATTPDAGIMTEEYVRKLTPKECWRLMGFTDEAFDKARTALKNKHYHGRDKANTQLLPPKKGETNGENERSVNHN